ncbi:unnamed protein product [Dimorphilus gyrociliatus]|uniref:SET domain-containing protein n=1 Tax=Dimorphilus gyrociliatus TaxID=2664684 RepID=A0A7I8VYN0_9ANNE|nr:unnamed protein product [Dimorphilus gyrociliatus]
MAKYATIKYDEFIKKTLLHLKAKYDGEMYEVRHISRDLNTLDELLKEIKVYKMKRRIDEEKAMRQRQRGNEYLAHKKHTTAIKIYSEALALSNRGSLEWSYCLANRAAALYSLKTEKELLQAKEDSLACLFGFPVPSRAKIFRRLGHICLHLDEKLTALEYFKKAIEIEPENSKNPSESLLEELKNAEIAPAVVPPSEPFKIDEAGKKGKGMYATRAIRIGEKILSREPYEISVTPGRGVCSGCAKKTGAPYPCDSCPDDIFCTEDCYAKNFAAHQIICGLANVLYHHSIGKLGVLAIKLLLREDSEWINMVANNLKRSNLEHLQFEALAYYICYFTGIRNHKKMLRALFIITCNGIEMSDNSMGLYPDISCINHSCNPNVDFIFSGSTCTVRAIKPIARNEQIFVDYGNNFATLDKPSRQNKLLAQYFFDCDCEACDEDWKHKNFTTMADDFHRADEDSGEKRRVKNLIHDLEALDFDQEVTFPMFDDIRDNFAWLYQRNFFKQPTDLYVKSLSSIRKLLKRLGNTVDNFYYT